MKFDEYLDLVRPVHTLHTKCFHYLVGRKRLSLLISLQLRKVGVHLSYPKSCYKCHYKFIHILQRIQYNIYYQPFESVKSCGDQVTNFLMVPHTK